MAEIEFGDDFDALGTGAQHTGFGALTERQRQCIDEDRLSCTGFAGEHRESGRKVQVQGIDDHEITNGKTGEHLL